MNKVIDYWEAGIVKTKHRGLTSYSLGALKKLGGGGSENLYTSKPTGGGAPKN